MEEKYAAQNRKSHNKVVVVVVLVIVALVAVAGVRLLDQYLNPEVSQVDDAVRIKITEAQKGDIKVTSVNTGKIMAENEVNVIPKIAGRVTAVDVELGDKVSKGDTLFKIDPSDIESQQSQAEIQLSAASKGRSAASESIDTAKSAEKKAKNQLKDIKKQIKDTKKAIKNTKKAIKNAEKAGPMGAAALAQAQAMLQKLEPALTQLESAKAQADAGVTQAGAGVTQARSAYDQATAQYELANEGINAAESAIDEMTVKTPISGYVTALTVQKGGMVGQTMPSAIITGTEKIEVSTTVAENLVSALHEGDPVDVFVRALSDDPFEGIIKSVVPSPQTGQTMYPVIITFDQFNESIKPGMFAEIEFVTGDAGNVVTIPSEAVTIRDGKEVVAVLGADDKVKIVEVETGLDDGTNVEIKGGVSAGENIIYEGQHYVDDDSKVKVVD